MKKPIRSLLTLILAFNMAAAPAVMDYCYSAVPTAFAAEETADVFSSDDFTFKINADGMSCSLISFDKESEEDELIIPGKVSYEGKEYTVTQIGNRAFSQKSFASATIPDTVKFIGIEAFAENRDLTEIVIPNSVTEIAIGAFAGSGLKSVTVPGSIKELGCCFNHCYDLEKVVIEKGVETIAMGCFFADNRITSFDYPESLIFADPFNLPYYSVKGLEKFKEMSDPFVYDKETGVVYRKYEDHAEVLTALSFNSIKSEIDGLPVTALAANGNFAIPDSDFVIPDFIEKIGKYSCAATSVNVLYIPDSVKEIEPDAFCLNFWLTDVSVPKSITNVDELFTFCDKLDPSKIVFDKNEILFQKESVTKLTTETEKRIYFKDGYNANMWLFDSEGTLEYFGEGKFECVWDTGIEYFGYCGQEFDRSRIYDTKMPDSIQMDYEIEADETDGCAAYAGIFSHGNDNNEYFLVDYYTPEAYEYITANESCGGISVSGTEYDVYCMRPNEAFGYYYCVRKAGSVTKNSVDAISFIKALNDAGIEASEIYDASVFVLNNAGKGKLNVVKNEIDAVYPQKPAEEDNNKIPVQDDKYNDDTKVPVEDQKDDDDVMINDGDQKENDDNVPTVNHKDENETAAVSSNSFWRSDASSVHLIFGAPASQEIIYGDINGDGSADLTDLTYLSLYLMGSSKFSDKQMKCADVDGSGSVDIADLPYFKQYVSKDSKVSKLGPKN